MARFFTVSAKKYDPANIDTGLFAMNIEAPRSVPLVCTSEVDPRYGNGRRQAYFAWEMR